MVAIAEKEYTPEEKAAILAEIIGFPGMQFVPWKKLMSEGFVVKLHVGRTRFRRRAFFSDYGIQIEDKDKLKKMEEVFTRGMKNYLPEKYLHAIDNADNRARACLLRHSIDTVWGRFVPWTAWADFQKEMAEHKEAYLKEMQTIIDEHEKVRKQTVALHLVAADNAYNILYNVSKEALSQKELDFKMAFLLKIGRRVRADFPTPEEIQRSIVFDLEYTFIDLPQMVPDEEQPITMETIEGLDKETTDRLRNTQRAMQQKEEMIRLMNKQVVSEMREKKREKIDAFLNDVVGRVRGMVYGTCLDVLTSVRSKQALNNANSKSLNTLIENLRKLNFYGDEDVNRVTELLSGILTSYDRGKTKTPIKDIEETLQKIALSMRTTVLTVGMGERAARESNDATEEEESKRGKREKELEQKRIWAGVPDRPTADQERAARESLGLSIPTYIRRERNELAPVSAPVVTGEEYVRRERTW